MRKRYLQGVLGISILLLIAACKKNTNIENEIPCEVELEVSPIEEQEQTQENQVTEEINSSIEELSEEIQNEVVPINRREFIAKRNLACEWKTAFCNRDIGTIYNIYEDHWKELMNYDYMKVDMLRQQLYDAILEDCSIVATDYKIDDEGNMVTIWYDALLKNRSIQRIRQTLTIGEVQGVLSVQSYEQVIYDEIDSKEKFEDAYGTEEELHFFDYYGNQYDIWFSLNETGVYQKPKAAAVMLLNLSGGKVESTDSTKDDGVEIVTYVFKDGSKVEIPMYQTYDGIWLPVPSNSKNSSSLHSDYKQYEESDYNNAVDITNDALLKGKKVGTLYLLSRTNDFCIYGTNKNYIILEANGVRRPYNIPWKSTNYNSPSIAYSDFDVDGEKEIALATRVGTGTECNIDSLYLFELAQTGLYQPYSYSVDEVIKQLSEEFLYLYNRETNQVEYYLGESKPVDIVDMGEVVQDNAEFECVQMGDFVHYTVDEQLHVEIELEGMIKEQSKPAFYVGTLASTIRYVGNGEFLLDEVSYISDIPKNPLTEAERGLTVNIEGMTYEYDLDGDNTLEEINYRRVPNPIDPYETYPELRIDDIVYDADALSDLGIYMCSESDGKWYLVDLDESDSYKEIAIFDYGPSDDPVTYFLRYDSTGLFCCGAIYDNPQSSSFIVHGDRTVSAMQRLFILQTWYANTLWTLSEQSILEETKPEWYYPQLFFRNAYCRNYLMRDVQLYELPDVHSNAVSLKQGEEIYLTATDDDHWIQVKTDAWNVGWIYMKDYETFQTYDEESIGVLELMTYLCYAD